MPKLRLGVRLEDVVRKAKAPHLTEHPGALAAYSLRDLSGTNPSVIRVRRSSDNTEQNFTAGDVVNGTLTTFCGAGSGMVTSLYDQSGNGHHKTQVTQSLQPTIVTNGTLRTRGGRPEIVFDTDFLSSVTVYSNNQPRFFFVATPSTASIGSLYSSSRSEQVIRFFSDNWDWWNLNPAVSMGTVANQQTLISTENNLIPGRQVIVRKNGALRGTATSVSTLPPSWSLPDLGTVNTAFYYSGGFQEMIIYPNTASPNIVSIESAINSHYLIY